MPEFWAVFSSRGVEIAEVGYSGRHAKNGTGYYRLSWRDVIGLEAGT